VVGFTLKGKSSQKALREALQYPRVFNGRYGQAWRRFFSGLQAAHECGIVHGYIERDETLNDLAEKLEENPRKPTESFKKLELAR
jgi:hypothetical protein